MSSGILQFFIIEISFAIYDSNILTAFLHFLEAVLKFWN